MGLYGRATEWNKYFTVAILTGINLLNYMDRFTLAGILDELQQIDHNGFRLHHKAEEVNDTEGGLLQTAFIVSYMLFSPLFGYLGDRYSRKYIMSIGILLWSLFTLAGSFSVNLWMLFSTRLLVGIGEASYATIAPTIIADLFPSEKRLRMLSIFYLAMPVGGALGYIVGSQVSNLVQTYAHQDVSWRWALRVTPTLGIIAFLLVLLVMREPPRGHTDGQMSTKGVRGKTGVKAYVDDVIYCVKNKTFVFTTIGFTAIAFTTGALAQWVPLFIERVSYIVNGKDGQYSETTAALLFGGITVVAGITGVLTGSELSKFLGRYTRKAEAIVCSMGMLIGTPFLFFALIVAQYKTLYVAMVLVFWAEFFFCLNWAPVAAILLYTVVPARRSTAESVQILFSHLFGDAISPTIVGTVSDAVYASTQAFNGPYVSSKYYGISYNKWYGLYGKGVSMEFALFITAFVSLLGGGAFLLSTFTVENDRKKVELYTQKKNARIQRNENSDSTSESDFDEHKELLADALKDADIVKVHT